MGFLNNIYSQIGFATDPKRFTDNFSFWAGLESACDEAEGPNAATSNGFTMFATGTVTPSIVPTDAWATPYSEIRACNQFLAHLSIIPFNTALKQQTEGEARFLRAWYYFILLEHYGGVPIVGDTVFNATSFVYEKRNSFASCVNYIVSECNTAYNLLPFTQTGANYGRVSGGACMGLISRVLLYAASPLFQNGGFGAGTPLDSIVAYPDNDPNRWVLAANAAQALIIKRVYSLYVDSANPAELGYGFMQLFLTRDNNEYILAHMMDPGNVNQGRYLEQIWDVPTGGGSAGPHVYQDLVDAFPMANGLAITDPNSGYDPGQPYQNRDPRLNYTIIHDSTIRPGPPLLTYSPVALYLNANVNPPKAASENSVYQGTPTGLYINKMLDTAVYWDLISSSNRCLPLIRYAEILLNYAEAENEAVGPTTNVFDAVQAVRQRAGLRPYTLPSGLDQAEMRLEIQNERRIEFAFEGLRYFDVRRWMIADTTEDQMMHGMQVARSTAAGTTYTEFNVRQHAFTNAMYLWPIPLSEIGKSKLLVQNPLY
jgi:hypothetical protein